MISWRHSKERLNLELYHIDRVLLKPSANLHSALVRAESMHTAIKEKKCGLAVLNRIIEETSYYPSGRQTTLSLLQKDKMQAFEL